MDMERLRLDIGLVVVIAGIGIDNFLAIIKFACLLRHQCLATHEHMDIRLFVLIRFEV
jgi:hypothetical protein